MKRSSLRGIGLAVLLALMAARVALAAPLAQDNTPTPTPTPTAPPFVGPTWTPLPTLRPLPAGGGRVAVSVLAVRFGPSQAWGAMGGLNYGTEVYPIARSVNGQWVAIQYGDDIGWILASLVEWHPGVDLMSLPVFLPPYTETPLGASSPGAAETVETVEPSPTSSLPTNTPRPRATATAEPSETPAPTDTQAPTATKTPAGAAVAPSLDEPDAEPETPPPGPTLTFDPRQAPWLLAILPVALLALYGWRFAAGQREIKRYAKEFPLSKCPVCQVGNLQREELVTRSLGVARMSRTVRCDTCRSVLRQVRPGVWRYMIDPYVNSRLAHDYNGRQFTDSQLQEFASRALSYEPVLPEQDIEMMQDLTDDEILAELESWIEEEDTEMAELPARPDEPASTDPSSTHEG